jgi:hypothetical protein
MRRHQSVAEACLLSGETPEQVLQGIRDSLAMLGRETAAIGMLDVRELIMQARDKINEWVSPENSGGETSRYLSVPLISRGVVTLNELNVLCKELRKLPSWYREPFMLRVVFDYSYDEVAERCNLSVESAKGIVASSFILVQEMLEETVLRAKFIELEKLHNDTTRTGPVGESDS